VVLMALMTSVQAFAAATGGQVGALTIRPLGIVKTDDLDFGTMLPGIGGNVTINAQTGARTTAGPVLAPGAFGPGRFLVAATPLRIITLSINPNNNLVLNRVGGGGSMTASQFRISYNNGAAVPVGPNFAIPLTGLVTIQMGGRLGVGNNQAEGVYEGIFTMTVNYQ